MTKILAGFFLVVLGLFGLMACDTNNETSEPTPNGDDDWITLTLEELAAFDGQDGRKAYIAVQGFIYDVSGSARWPNGNHNGYQAGQDLTDEILNVSPHGARTLDNVPQIGELVE